MSATAGGSVRTHLHCVRRQNRGCQALQTSQPAPARHRFGTRPAFPSTPAEAALAAKQKQGGRGGNYFPACLSCLSCLFCLSSLLLSFEDEHGERGEVEGNVLQVDAVEASLKCSVGGLWGTRLPQPPKRGSSEDMSSTYLPGSTRKRKSGSGRVSWKLKAKSSCRARRRAGACLHG